MTWGEWVSSVYNTDGFYIGSDGYVYNSSNLYIPNGHYTLEIINNYIYTCVPFGN
jgi:hypothetical protein